MKKGIHKTLLPFVVIFYMLFLNCSILYSTQNDSLLVGELDTTKIGLYNTYQTNSNEPVSEIFYATVNEKLLKPIRVRVLFNQVKPLEKIPVVFKVITTPKKSVNTKFIKDTVLTDINGFAETFVLLGTEEGEYEFSARINVKSTQNDIVYFKAYARESNWVFFLITGLLGGLALFLFGMEMMSEGMKKLPVEN